MKSFLKKFLVIFLSVFLCIPASVCGFADGDISCIAVSNEEDPNVFEVTFSAPVHVFKSGWVWIRYKSPEDGDFQRNPTEIKYVGKTTEKNGETYSDVLEFVFPEPDPQMESDACGFCIVEYFLDDENEGHLSTQVISGLDGEAVKTTYSAGGLDFLWVPTDNRDLGNAYSLHVASGQSAPVDVKETVECLSVVNEKGSNVYTATFSAPVRIFKDGWVWIRYKGPEDSDFQRNPSSIKYIGENNVEKAGETYSDVLEITFPDADPQMDTDACGLCLVEYFLDDTKQGLLSPQVISGANGERVKATYTAGPNDFLWIPTDKRDAENAYKLHILSPAHEIRVSSTVKAGNTVYVIFDYGVAFSGVTDENGKAPTRITALDGKDGFASSYELTFDENFEGNKLIINELKGVNNEDFGKMEIDTEKYTANMGRDISAMIENKKLYSFMNCDTGRMLTLDGKTEFRVFKEEGNNVYSLRDEKGEKYLSFDKDGKLSLTDTPFFFNLFLDNDYERFQLRSAQTVTLIADNDKGDTADAVLSALSSSNTEINTGWYLTKHGDELPMRVAMVGDSITNGCTPDGNTPKAGCRAILSTKLIEKYGRVVFVGSAVASHGGDGSGGEHSHIDEPFLYREDGHNGWVVTSHEGYNPANNYGIDTIRENLQTKYKPDVVCMMLGINDVNQLGLGKVANDPDDDFYDRWTKLVNDFLADLPDTGRMIIGTLTPSTNGSYHQWRDGERNTNGFIKLINENLVKIVEGIATTDSRISWTDNFEYVYNAGPEGVSTDGLHLNEIGYAAMAESYYSAVTKVADGIMKREVEEDTFKTDDEAETTDKGEISPGKRGGLLVFGIVLGTALIAVATGVIVSNVSKKKKNGGK